VPAPGTDPLTITDLGQLFMDFNFRVHPVPARVAIALDQSDIYISPANQLAKEPFIAKHGGMEMKAASRGKKSTSLGVQGVLLLGVIHHDINHRGLNLSPAERTLIYDVTAGLDWSRNNKEWIDEAGLGQWTVPKGGTKEQVVILGAGRNNAQAIIDFVRKRTGLRAKLDAKKQHDELSKQEAAA
jgi:hypothetical protein